MHRWLEQTWLQSRAAVKQRWDDLTQEDLSFIAGRKDRLVDKIRERYGISREEAQGEVQDFERSLQPGIQSHA